MSRVAKKLGYDHSFLHKHLPQLCRAVSSKFEKYRAEQREEKNAYYSVKFARLRWKFKLKEYIPARYE
jgi:hypothetical protein